jgi:hypothetical protein
VGWRQLTLSFGVLATFVARGFRFISPLSVGASAPSVGICDKNPPPLSGSGSPVPCQGLQLQALNGWAGERRCLRATNTATSSHG